MKCPKCSYLGFETGDRCKNCGYDFSLAVPAISVDPGDADLTLRVDEQDGSATPGWLDSIDLHGTAAGDVTARPPSARAPASVAAAGESPRLHASRSAAAESGLPLFTRVTAEDDPDEPLIKLPAAPRPPLAVRRTAEAPRLRAVPKPAPRPPEPEPVLEFEDEHPVVSSRSDEASPRTSQAADAPEDSPVAPSWARITAAVTDLVILLAIDAVVVYLTVRMAGLTMNEWTALPLGPLAAFLLLVKFGYFSAFTAVGGQTIGKMAVQVRVVTESGGSVDAGVAVTRAVIGLVSAMAFGLGFLPAFMTADRRALHDRLAGTRVISMRAA